MEFFRLVRRCRWLVVIASILVTVVLGLQVRHLRINADLTSYLPKTDPAVKTLEHVAETFGGNFLAVMAIEAHDLFTPGGIQAIHDLTTRLQLIDGVNYVTSLTNILDLKKTPEGLEIGKLVSEEDLPLSEEACEALRTYVLSKKRYAGRIVAAEGKVSLIIVAVHKDADKEKVIDEIEKTLSQTEFAAKAHLAGLPFQLREISRYIINDLKVLSPLVGIIIFLSLLLSFRHLRGVIIPLTAVIMSALWTLGIMSLLRVPLTIISDAIPVLLLAIGSAYSIHVINRFEEGGLESKEAGLAHVAASVFLAAVTTIAGFMSFVFGSYLTAIREFGVFASLGVLVSLILSVTFVPAWLFISQEKKRISQPPQSLSFRSKPGFVIRLQNSSLKFLRHGKFTLGVFCLIILVAFGGISRIKRHSNMLDYFEPQSEIRQSEAFLESRGVGSIPVNILVQGDICNPQVLRRMKELEAFLELDPLMHHPVSIADYLAEMNDLMGEGETIPDTREKVNNLLFLLEGQEGLDQLLTPDKTEAVIQAMTPSLDMGQMKSLVDRVESWLREHPVEAAKFSFSGSPLVYIHLDRSLLSSQVVSLGLALVLIYFCVWLLIRSLRGAFLGMIPIGFTLILIFGLMGYARIPLDIATVLVGSVSIGIGIDYSLHWLNRFRLEVALTHGQENLTAARSPASKDSPSGQVVSPNEAKEAQLLAAVERTLRSAGRAVFINMVTVALGFLVLVFANLIPLRRFGLLVAVTMLASGTGALSLLPSVIVLTGARWLKRRR